jgi:hypothetical protein
MVHRKDAEGKIIPSKMIVRAKRDSSGKFTRFKGRLVARGDRQERTEETLSSSPTVSKFTINTICVVTAKDGRGPATADVKGAYLEGFLKEKIPMKLVREISGILVELYPQYGEYLDEGKIVVNLIRALYGCVESALIWYEVISTFLTSLGIHDECLFFKGSGKDSMFIAVYVDDLFISAAHKALIDTLESHLKGRSKDITINRGKHHEYLGAHLDFSISGQVTMTMETKSWN